MAKRERKREKTPLTAKFDAMSSKGIDGAKAIEKEYAKLPRDWSAEERFVNRSFRIRKDIKKWIGEHLGQIYSTSSELSDECAYECKCSPITAYRWLHFWSSRGAPYLIEEQAAGLVLKERPIV